MKNIGGSIIAAIMGVSEYKTPLDAYHIITGDNPFEGSKYTFVGNLLEPVIISYFEQAKQCKIEGKQKKFEHLGFPHFLCYVDGIESENKFVLSVKNTSKEVDTEDISNDWLHQINWEMGISGIHEGHIVWLSKGYDFGFVYVMFDEILFSEQVRIANDFWNNHIIPGVPPLPSNPGDILNYIKSKDTTKTASNEVESKIKQLTAVKNQIKWLESEEKQLTDEIKMVIVESETLVNEFGGILATWKCNKSSNVVDYKELEKTYPEICDQFRYKKEGARTFRIKAKKE